MAMKTHRRYSDNIDRPDLMALAVCNNINGRICDDAHLTSDDASVTCGSCRRIREGSDAVPRKAFSNADLRRVSRSLGRRGP